MKKDILILCQYFYPEYVSSATLPFDTAKFLIDEGFTVDVVTGYPKEYSSNDKVSKREKVYNIHIRRLKYLQFSRKSKIGRLINYFSLTMAMFFKIFSFKKYKRIIIYSNPPLLIYIGYLCHKFFKSEITFICYDIYPEIAVESGALKQKSIVYKIMKHINKKAYLIFKSVVTLSEDMKQFMLQNRNIDSEKIHVIPNWYEDEPYAKDVNTILDFQDLDGKFLISYLGNIGKVQDIDIIKKTIIDFKDHSKIMFVFAGHGNEYDTFKNFLIEENIKNVKVLNFLKSNDYNYILYKSNICLITLKKGIINLASPSKLYPYMMAGKPIIAILDESSVYAKEINKFGFAVEPGSSTKLTEKINIIYNDLDLREKFEKKSRMIFLEKYEKNKALSHYRNVFKREE